MHNDCTPEQGLPSATEPTNTPSSARDGWIGWSLIAGIILAVPLGYLLAFLAALPFMLGLFFFLLLGLIVAATMFRFGIKAPPPSRPVAWAMGTIVTVVLMGTMMWAEYQALPRSLNGKVRKSYFESFTPEKLAEMQQGVRSFLSDYMATNYPPGGLTGYLRWAATNGQMACPRILREGTEEYRLPYRKGMWMFRNIVSLLLVEWTIMSQMLALRTEGAARILVAEPHGPDAPEEKPPGAA
jgi:hypothetical protein